MLLDHSQQETMVICALRCFFQVPLSSVAFSASQQPYSNGYFWLSISTEATLRRYNSIFATYEE